MSTMEKKEIKILSLEERIRSGGINFEEAKQEQERNYGIAVRHVEVPGDPKGEEWTVKVGDRTLTFEGANAKEKMEKWTRENGGVVVVVERKTGRTTKILAGKLVDDIFSQKAAEDEAIADSFGD